MRIAEALVDKRGKVNDVLFSALSDINDTYQSGIMTTLVLSENDRELLQAVSKELAFKRSEWLPKGKLNIEPVDMPSGFAQTLTDKGIIKLSTNDAEMTGFIPAKNFISALRKIAVGDKLLFDEEYSVEIVWHEFLHLRTPNIEGTYINETITQFVARHSYQELLKTIGVNMPIHQQDILAGGYAYKENINNFRYTLSRFGIDELRAAEELQNIYLKSGNELRSNVSEWLSSYNGKSRKKNSNILGLLDENKTDFKKMLEKILSYNATR